MHREASVEVKKVFQTDKAAVTGGPYSQAIIHNGIIYVSGMGSVDPQTNEIKLGTVEEEAEMALENLRIIFEAILSLMYISPLRILRIAIITFSVASAFII